MAATSTARTVAMIGTARATSSISATGPDTVATTISAAADSPCATPVRAKGGKRIHRKNENRIVRDERSEGAKRHERRMIAKYGNTEGPNRRHSKKNRHNAPFRMKSGRR